MMDIMADDVVHKKRMAEGFKGQQSCILPEQNRRFCATHTLCRKLYITDIGFYPHAALHNRERPGGAEQYILIYCVKGAGWYRMEGKTFAVKENHYFIIPPGKAHEYGADEQNPWSIYWVHFMGEQAGAICKFLWSSRQTGPQAAAPSPLRNMIFDDIMHHLELMNNEENIIYANSCVYAFLVSFKQAQLRAHDRKNHPVEEVITYMKNNLDKNLTLEQLSKAVKMSPSHLSALFRQKTKYSPVNLFVSLKMQKAGQLLLESKHSVKHVGHSLGYDDPYHFSRVFKKTMGMSPKQFKESTS